MVPLTSSNGKREKANFERELIVHFQTISKAAALYAKALLGGVRRALEIYRRCDSITNGYDWVTPTAEETWHDCAEGSLMAALKSMNIPTKAWQAAKFTASNSQFKASDHGSLSLGVPSSKC